MVQARVLDSDHGLVADDIQDLQALTGEVIFLRMSEQQHTIGIQTGAQGDATSGFTGAQSYKATELGIFADPERDLRLTGFDSIPDHASQTRQGDAHVRGGETAGRFNPQARACAVALTGREQ